MREIDKVAFGKRFASRRKKLGLSQAKLAEAVESKQQSIGNIEKGIVERPRNLHELAEALGTTREWLLYNEGPEQVVVINPLEQAVALLQAMDTDHLPVAIRFLKNLVDRSDAA